MGGSLEKQRPLHGPWGLALLPCSKATCLRVSPGEELEGDSQCSRVAHGLEQAAAAAGIGLRCGCLLPWLPSSSVSLEPMFALDPGGFVLSSRVPAEASPGVTSSPVPCYSRPRALHHHLAPPGCPVPDDAWADL